MTDLNLDQSAELLWLDVAAEDLAEAPGWHGTAQSFDSAREAVRYCIEELDLRLRNFARIALADEGFIEAAEAEKIYAEMTG